MLAEGGRSRSWEDAPEPSKPALGVVRKSLRPEDERLGGSGGRFCVPLPHALLTC